MGIKEAVVSNIIVKLFIEILQRLWWRIVKRTPASRIRVSVSTEAAKVVVLMDREFKAGETLDVKVKVTPPYGWTREVSKAKSSFPCLQGPVPERESVLPNELAKALLKVTMSKYFFLKKVLRPPVAYAIYLYIAHKTALSEQKNEMADVIMEGLEKFAVFEALKEFSPQDVKKMFKLIGQIDRAGNLVGVVLPILREVSEMVERPSKEIRNECENLIQWASTIGIRGKFEPSFEILNLIVEVILIGEKNWREYSAAAAYACARVLSRSAQKYCRFIFGAYGRSYSAKGLQASAVFKELYHKKLGLQEIIVTPQHVQGEVGETPPFLASYIHITSNFYEHEKETEEEMQKMMPHFQKRGRLIKVTEKTAKKATKVAVDNLNQKYDVLLIAEGFFLSYIFDSVFQVLNQTSSAITQSTLTVTYAENRPILKTIFRITPIEY